MVGKIEQIKDKKIGFMLRMFNIKLTSSLLL